MLCKILPIAVLIGLSISFRVEAANIIDEPSNGDPLEGNIVVTGSIEEGDGPRFNQVIQKYSRGFVALNSLGGNLLAGIDIGRTIRLKGFNTLVSDGGVCASSCALAWLGGAHRFLSPTASLGFHAAYLSDANGKHETGVGNALVGAYLTQIGLPTTAVIYITKASPDSITLLSPEDAKNYGIDTIFMNGNFSVVNPSIQSKDPKFITPPTAVSTTSSVPVVASPSFDCAFANRDDEKTICADPILGRIDALLSNLMKSSKSADLIRVRKSLSEKNVFRSNCHSDPLCILSVQEQALTAIGAPIPEWVRSYHAKLVNAGQGSVWKPAIPQHIGDCLNTSIIGLSDRFGETLNPKLGADGWDSGSSAVFRNGGYVVSYNKEIFLLHSKRGDMVRMYLASIPKDCPVGDERGRAYLLINHRTHESVVMADSQHMCGGA